MLVLDSGVSVLVLFDTDQSEFSNLDTEAREEEPGWSSVPGTRRRRNHVHLVQLPEVVEADDIVIERGQFDTAHKRSQTQGRRQLHDTHTTRSQGLSACTS